MTKTTDTSPISLLAFEDGSDPIEDRLRTNIRATDRSRFRSGAGWLPWSTGLQPRTRRREGLPIREELTCARMY